MEVNASQVLLKAYFHHPNDPRDRLGTEFGFSTFAWLNGLRTLPRPLACQPENHLGLYEFIEGRRLEPHEVMADAVEQAADFFHRLNRYKEAPAASALPIASEACFSLTEHLHCVERRLQNLQRMNESSNINREAARFTRNELSAVWEEVRHSVHRCDVVFDKRLNRGDWCLSPSDFGFHNAILTPIGRLRFIDFEYAGWDDPAKMVCDFFCQVALPAPMEGFERFAGTVVSGLSGPTDHLERIALLMPVYQLKWCCILLNNFLPIGRARRQFADEETDPNEQKVNQLRLARALLTKVSRNA